MGKKVFVGNLSFQCTEQDLFDAFQIDRRQLAGPDRWRVDRHHPCRPQPTLDRDLVDRHAAVEHVAWRVDVGAGVIAQVHPRSVHDVARIDEA